MCSPASLAFAFASLSHAYIFLELPRQRKRGTLLITTNVSSMAASDISLDQFAKLCKRCACLQLRSTTADETLPRNLSTGEQEVDLDWNVTDVLYDAFHEVETIAIAASFFDELYIGGKSTMSPWQYSK